MFSEEESNKSIITKLENYIKSLEFEKNSKKIIHYKENLEFLKKNLYNEKIDLNSDNYEKILQSINKKRLTYELNQLKERIQMKKREL